MSLIQIHLISFKHVPIHSDALEPTQIHTASLQIFSASLRLIQIQKDLRIQSDQPRFVRFSQMRTGSLRSIQIHTDFLKFTQIHTVSLRLT